MSQTSAAIEWVSDVADAPFLLAGGGFGGGPYARARPTMETQPKAALRQTSEK